MKVEKFNKHRPVDTSDPGFTIPGYKLRWINGKVAENNPGRIWAVLRKGDFPNELVKHLTDHNPGAFTQGDTIRRGDLVLACASREAAAKRDAELAEMARDQEYLVKRAPAIVDQHGRNRAKVEVNEERDVTDMMIEKFKKQNEED